MKLTVGMGVCEYLIITLLEGCIMTFFVLSGLLWSIESFIYIADALYNSILGVYRK